MKVTLTHILGKEEKKEIENLDRLEIKEKHIVRIGREPKSEFPVSLDYDNVSGKHCKIIRDNKFWNDGLPRLFDTSTNGTVVKRGDKEYKVPKNEAYILNNSDVIILAKYYHMKLEITN